MIDIDFPAEHITVIKNWLKTGSINIFGLPFAGKDTHGETLSALLDAPLLGGGEILRGSIIPPEIKAELDAGHLIPTADYLRIVTPYLSRKEFEGKPLILSSVGRWAGEEEGVLAATRASGHPTKAVVYLHAGEEVVFRRWKKSQEKGDRAGRADDVEDVLETRIQEFNEKTLPVIEVYRQKKLLIEVNSDAEKIEVLENILARLYLLACSTT
ncbi:MAG TPA: nucleoside monophosphate kinase [Candidatus Saccharimonadales bacterium]|nr:nucleoside monophosphate kinase [Candidatus Saccharimonadales bacterium]